MSDDRVAGAPPDAGAAADVELLVARTATAVVASAARRRLADPTGGPTATPVRAERGGEGIGRPRLGAGDSRARPLGLTRSCLETGATDHVRAVGATYAAAGYEPGAPFGSYEGNGRSPMSAKGITPEFGP